MTEDLKSYPAHFHFRTQIFPDDPKRIRDLVEITGFFFPAEVDVAEELVHARLETGDKSGYFFILAETPDLLVGYTCYGPIPCTESSYDLYWIAVHPNFQRSGLGKKLMAESEQKIHHAGGTRIYVETSSRDQYIPTRLFYEKIGYHREAVITDFYSPGDSKIIYCKVVDGSNRA
jgi:ribosomal protein S18 acetylase RimI-like enzyme